VQEQPLRPGAPVGPVPPVPLEPPAPAPVVVEPAPVVAPLVAAPVAPEEPDAAALVALVAPAVDDVVEEDELVGFPSAMRSVSEPSKTSRSTFPDPEMPGTVPVLDFCQNVQLVNGAGTSGQDTPQFATPRMAWFSKPAGLPSVPETKLGDV
jgi:hypothetical protein